MKSKTNLMKNEIQTAAAKQEYQAPELSELGGLTELTLATGVPNLDGTTGSV